jgi:hypothetical protein
MAMANKGGVTIRPIRRKIALLKQKAVWALAAAVSPKWRGSPLAEAEAKGYEAAWPVTERPPSRTQKLDSLDGTR